MTTEIPSATPLKNKASTEIQNTVEIPKMMMQTPKAKMAPKSFMPAFLYKGT